MFDLTAFEAVTENLGFHTNASIQERMGMSNGVVSRIKSGQCQPGGKFIRRLPLLGITWEQVSKPADRVKVSA